ncbi:MAG: glucose-6-phosphate dehydrogenase [Planctomycetota bacterium]|nr:MAG: glucose-6-phosphate dehydrogenase [Planctomycetota bacterium]REJ98782.1 MAG: glucose-6-phosphate dehydrogenase [Planctomycetota bacterium]REK27627.1 MAG: glucose-6-phosphate dehydrogenase [Planctomycetota bacterium]REK43238.1 MAG: glucose-6-phosphate dehydrogenase [Planctomycetota bacterium]
MSHTIVILGASGDLTSRKLIPALYSLYRKGRLPEKTQVLGFSRTAYSHEAWRDKLTASTQEFVGDEFESDSWQAFAQHIFYQPGDIENAEDFDKLVVTLAKIEDSPACTRVYYLSTAPRFYEPAVTRLAAAGLASEAEGPRRVVIEKPFGTDGATAHRLNEAVHRAFDEHQVYRIDHYLGKETVQNLMVLRFANAIFEPVWNRNYIDHVQITVAEEVLVGRRGGYYDSAGVLRDMFQNHLLQLLMITAMEAPVRYEADLVRDEKVKVLRAIRALSEDELCQSSVRGQYRGYLDEPGVAADSRTPTFAATRLWIDNWRWQGVPFYLRSGKGMSCRTTQIVIQFVAPPHSLFGNKNKHAQFVDANRLVIQIQPAEGIQLHFESKVPDGGMRLRMSELDFRFAQDASGRLPDAYQPLLCDALAGEASLFARSDEVELAWDVIDPFLASWAAEDSPNIETYEPGGWGPECSTRWMRDQGRQWFDTCPVLK